MSNCYLEFQSISKCFPGVQALDGVSFSVAEGSVHALLGENGAGKSTLLKILGGVYIADSGVIRLAGQPQSYLSTSDAIRAGIAIIHQELQLVPEMSVEANIFLGQMPNRLGLLNKRALRAAAQQQLDALEEDIDPAAKVSSLSVAQRQMVEIAKALARDAKVIAFDEPTSSLSDREVRKLFSVIAELKRCGRVIIYVSHRLQEVFEVCDRATVFRDGKVVDTLSDISQVTAEMLVNRMVGRSIADIYGYSPRPVGDPALDIEGLDGPGLAQPASFAVGRGEIVGLFGLVGAGRSELLKLIYGATRASGGRIRVCGKEVGTRDPGYAIRCGIAFCPEERKKEGIVPLRSVRDNINMSVQRSMSRFGVLNRKRELENARNYMSKLSIKAHSLGQLVQDLSGGNQQKVILARALSGDVKVMLLDEPTRGIDVGAKSEIYGIISQLAERGMGILVSSSELPEVMGISDRILVMQQGKIVGSVDRESATEQSVLTLALPTAVGAGVGRGAS